jgi:septum formation protein
VPHLDNLVSECVIESNIMVFPEILLASNSPRRRQMLAWTGLKFEVCPANIDETPLNGESPAHMVERLSEIKARTAAAGSRPGQLILAADTIVVDGSTILGKPENAEDAARMLVQLRGRVHQVFTAIALFQAENDHLEKDLCVSNVPMREYSNIEIDTYVASGDPMDKAGAYAIQHPGFHPVVDFKGCFASVMGLPLCHLEHLLRRFGVALPAHIPEDCLSNLNYSCPIYSAVQRGEITG